MSRVLVVEDDPQLVRALVINLQARQYGVDAAPDGTSALRLAAEHRPDAVLLDLGLPDMDGLDVLKGLRTWTGAPVLVISARRGSPEKIAALEAGADDYLTKPFSMDELIARLRAALRRTGPTSGTFGCRQEPAVVETGEFTVDLLAKRVRRAGRDVRLTPTEWQLLEILICNPGRLVSQRRLLGDVWGPGHSKNSNYLRVYMAQLRRKLEPDPAHPRHLITEPGMGYRFEA
ncbi:response regulator [Streptomyces sp. NPDC087440]|uniref:response regulator n=1 Tax=Streptomyces sp. NPDC087440 TaxID=3365790 RepID=UPI003804AB51